MSKPVKILIVLATVLAAVTVSVFAAQGLVKLTTPPDIATYTSPDGAHTLHYRQIEEPYFFGPATVEFLVTDADGRTVARQETKIYDDGGQARADNIVSVTWTERSVTVVAEASEMLPTEIVIPLS